MACKEDPKDPKGILICERFEDRGFQQVIYPHLLRVVAIFAGVLLGVLVVSIPLLVLRDIVVDFIFYIMSLFPPAFQLVGLFIGATLFLMIMIGLQLFGSWLVTRWIIKRYEKSWQMYRTHVQHRVARIVKYFSQGCFLALFIAIAISPFINLYLTGDLSTGIFIFGALALIFSYGGSTVGYLLTDILFYYHYKRQGGTT